MTMKPLAPCLLLPGVKHRRCLILVMQVLQPQTGWPWPGSSPGSATASSVTVGFSSAAVPVCDCASRCSTALDRRQANGRQSLKHRLHHFLQQRTLAVSARHHVGAQTTPLKSQLLLLPVIHC